MARKRGKGYFVDGEFIVKGSPPDLQFRAEMKGTDAASRSELKRESTGLQALGEELLTLRADVVAGLQLPEKLHDAVLETARITNFEGRRRHLQFIGKLMRQQESHTLDAIRAALQVQHAQSAEERRMLHTAEAWRDALIADDDQLQRWITAFPATEAQQLRALIRQVRNEQTASKAIETARKGRAYRELFSLIRRHMTPGSNDGPGTPKSG